MSFRLFFFNSGYVHTLRSGTFAGKDCQRPDHRDIWNRKNLFVVDVDVVEVVANHHTIAIQKAGTLS